jgi:anionic cell wall polymer biosynthesis LytR-Cps2A-Psr (LCP) family protein
MKLYHSTRDASISASADAAILRGISPGGGLYVPAQFNKISLKDLMGMTAHELFAHILENLLDGYQTLCYARLRKVGHGDYERTERQRNLITSMLESLAYAGLMEMHDMFSQVLPMITTNMTNKQITDLAFEMIPMLKGLQIQSQRIPYDDNQYTMSVEIDGVIDYQLGCDTKATGKRLRESIGMVEE